MRWFKHLTASRTDPDIGAIIDRFGFKGYFLFFRTLEIMSDEFSIEKPAENEFNFKWFLDQFPRNIDKKTLIKFYGFCQDSLDKRRIIYKINGNKISVNFPKLKDLTDDYTARVIRSKSEVNPKSIQNESEKNPSHRNKNKEIRNKNKEKSPKLKYSDIHMALSLILERGIKERLPKYKIKGNEYLESWANTFRIMLDNEEATYHEIQRLIHWIFGESDFWYKNILSAENFRKQFGRLWEEMGDEKPRKDTIGQSQQKDTPEQKEWKDKYYKARTEKQEELSRKIKLGGKTTEEDLEQIEEKLRDDLATWTTEYYAENPPPKEAR